MLLLKLSEGTAARRRIPIALVDDTDGKTAETGITLSAGDLKISKNGAAEANHAGTLTELAGGDYYYEATSGELDTLGYLTGRLVKTGVRTFRFAAHVVAFDPYDAVRAGLTALPNAAAEAAGGLYTRGSGAGQINQAANGMIDTNPVRLNNVAQSLLDLKDFADDGYDPATNKVQGVALTDTLTTYTGNTPQTGDAFARLGAPAGASVSADIAAIEAQTDDIGAAGAGLTAVPWNPAWDAEVQSEVQDALESNNLDHLVKTAVETDFATTVHLDSVLGQMADNGTTATFSRATDSLEALRDRGDAAWVTASPPTTGAIADAVWDEILSGHLGAGSTGEALSAAGGAGDPWITALPGSYSSGQAGFIVGTNLNATVSSRLATAGYTAPDNASITAILADTGTDGVVVAAGSKTGYTLSSAGIQAIWDAATSALTTVGSIGKYLLDRIIGTLATGTHQPQSGDAFARLGAPAGASVSADIATRASQTSVDDVPTNAELSAALASADDAVLAAIAALNNLAAGAAMTLTTGERNSIADALLARSLGTEAYAADGVVPTVAEMQYMLYSALAQFAISGTALTTKKLDGTTTAMTFTLDSATTPTSRVRSG